MLPTVSCLTSDDTEEFLDPHVDVYPAEELVHVAPPLLQDGAGRLEAGSTGSTGTNGRRLGSVSAGLTGENFTQPTQHQLQPLFTQKNKGEMKIFTFQKVGPRRRHPRDVFTSWNSSRKERSYSPLQCCSIRCSMSLCKMEVTASELTHSSSCSLELKTP